VVQASRRDAAFYEVISLVELLRSGRVREVALARELLEARLGGVRQS
jgi:hypothetical protein